MGAILISILGQTFESHLKPFDADWCSFSQNGFYLNLDMYMLVCVCACAHAHTHVCLYLCMYVCMHACISVYARALCVPNGTNSRGDGALRVTIPVTLVVLGAS